MGASVGVPFPASVTVGGGGAPVTCYHVLAVRIAACLAYPYRWDFDAAGARCTTKHVTCGDMDESSIEPVLCVLFRFSVELVESDRKSVV